MSKQSPPLLYSSYAMAKKEISGIKPIDYFFARELVSIFDNNNALSNVSIDTSNEHIAFHLLIALSESLRAGHTCLPLNSIANHHFGYSSDDFGVVQHHGYVFPTINVLDHLLTTVDFSVDANHPIVYHDNTLYMRRYFTFEQSLIQTIKLKTEVLNKEISNKYSEGDIKQCLYDIFPPALKNKNESKELDWQKVAVANALNKDFSVIAGGPGTGKTYTVTKLLAALVYLNNLNSIGSNVEISPLKMALVAPTGKAAQRLSESLINAISGFKESISDDVLNAIPTSTQTIHRLLGVIPHSPNFRHNENNLLNIDVLLIDEVSMVDLAMMVRVFRALPLKCKVILLGDADQLPSVSAGSVLNDIAPRPFIGYSDNNADYLENTTEEIVPKLSNKYVKKSIKEQFGDSVRIDNQIVDYVTFLTKSRRFDSHGGIGLIAKSVILGEYDTSWSILNQSNGENQVYHLQHDTMNWLLPLVETYYLPIFLSDNVQDIFSLFSKFRILCATRIGEQGVENFNELVTSILIDRNIIRFDDVMYQGRPIMITENNYVQGLYNGDVGFLWRHDSGHLMAVFEDSDNGYKWIMTSKLPNFETVFAMTIHKTQGSEFEHVAMVLPNQKENRLLSRELLYTGITRAKKQLSIATSSKVWRQGVETNVKRHSGFSV